MEKKGEGKFKRISWNKALIIVSEKIKDLMNTHGTESIWPYYYAGTMGLVQRDSINRLRNFLIFQANIQLYVIL